MNILNQDIRNVPLTEIQEHPNNARRGDMAAIQDSVDENGFWGTIVVQKSTGFIVAGNHRYRAAKEAGYKEVPVAFVDVDDTKAKKILAADNRTSDLGDYDNEALAHLLDDLNADEHLAGTGYNVEDLDDLINGLSKTIDVSAFKRRPPQAKEETEPVPEPPKSPITKPGDLWILGNHRLLCGDSTNPQHVERLMDGKKADMVFTDPPYNIGFGGTMSNTTRDGKLVPHVGMNARHAAIHNDKKTPEEFQDFISSVLSVIRLHCAGAYYISFGSGNFHELLTPVASSIGYKSIIIWVKNQSPMGGGAYRRRYEPIVYGNLSGDFYGKPYAEDDVWEFDRTNKNDVHPTMKPVDLVANAISHGSKPGGSVLDLFMGSGTTIIAAEQQRRSAYGMELDPAYVDVIVERWENLTGQKATRLPT